MFNMFSFMIWPLASHLEVRVILKYFLEVTGPSERRRLLNRHTLLQLLRKVSWYLYTLLNAQLGTALITLLGTRLPVPGTSSAWLLQKIQAKQALPESLPEVLIPSCSSSLMLSSLPLGLS